MKNTKLYTREQMIQAFKYGQNPKGFDWIGDMIDSLKPIELPTAVEVDAKAEDVFREYPNNPKEYPEWKYNKDINAPRKRKAFIMGSNWVINQIKKQSDEHNTNKG